MPERTLERPQIAQIVDTIITPDLVYSTLARLQGPAPSTTEPYTRTPILQELLNEAGVSCDNIDVRFLSTRSPAVFLRHPQSMWFSAHTDTISYLVAQPTNRTSFPILPNCAHRPKVAREFPAAVMRYNPRMNVMEIISEGLIGSDNQMKPYYNAGNKPKDGFKPGYDRVVFTPKLALV